MCIIKPWPPLTISPVYHWFFFGFLLILFDTDHYRLADALTQSSRLIWPSFDLLKCLWLIYAYLSNQCELLLQILCVARLAPPLCSNYLLLLHGFLKMAFIICMDKDHLSVCFLIMEADLTHHLF